MRPLVLVTRPAGLAAETAAAARALGLVALEAPLLEIKPVAFAPPETAPDALLFTSPQAPARAAAGGVPATVPCWAVGARTARAAEAAGFRVAATGDAGGAELLAAMAAAGCRRILHLRGADAVPLAPPAGVQLDARVVYRAVPARRLAEDARAALAGGRVAAVLLFSPRTAGLFATLADAEGLARAQIALAAISGAAAAAAGPGWARVEVAAAPSEAAVLAAALRLAEARAGGAEGAA